AQLPALRPGLPGHPRTAGAPCPARPHRGQRGHLRLGRAGRPPPLPRPPVRARFAAPGSLVRGDAAACPGRYRHTMIRKLAAEFLGTAILVFFAVGVATLMFGFRFAGASVAAGVVATALAFGLTLLALVYLIGPVSGCHVNPAVTVGALLAGRIPLVEAVGYWIAQFAGGIVGALALWGAFSTSPRYSRTITGLGTDGWGKASLINIGVGGA